MTVRDLDMSTGDLALVGGELVFIEGVSAVVQRVQQRMETMLGEWAFDTRVGIDWLRVFQEAPPDVGRLRAELIAQIETPPEVERVTHAELVFVREARVLRFTFAYLVDLGDEVQVEVSSEATFEEYGAELLIQVQMMGGVS
jgi:hypothetical protein